MLAQSDLARLARTLQDRLVLSVYLDGTATDFAAQHEWRLRLDNALRSVRAGAEQAPRAEWEELARAIARLEDRVAGFVHGLGAPGWAAFVTADAVEYAQRLPVPMPTSVTWCHGPCVVPYVRALKETRPVVVLLADARRVTLYRYRVGELERSEVVHAHAQIGSLTHLGAPPSAGFHPGVRGPTGHDAAQRALRGGTQNMIDRAASHALHLARPDGWLLTGGIERICAQVIRALPPSVSSRTMHLPSLDIHATPAEVALAAQQGASALRDRADLARIEALQSDDAPGRTGAPAVDDALSQHCVRELFFNRAWAEQHPIEAERAVRAALAQGAEVEEVSGAAATALDRLSGVAARLRYAPGGLIGSPVDSMSSV